MKEMFSLLCIITSTVSCNLVMAHNGGQKADTVISKAKYKTNNSQIDSLWVSQNDTTVFRQEEVVVTRPCSHPKIATQYNLIAPRDSTYYFIYNRKGNLQMEGTYTHQYTYKGATAKRGNFYDSKTYYYSRRGNLEAIHYQEDGRNLKTEYFDSKKRLSKIRYIDKKSESTTRVEIYNKGTLKETRLYTGFANYTVIKAEE